MKKILLVFVLVAGIVWGIEVQGLAGFNTETWQDDNGNSISGAGLHMGVLGGIGLTPSCLPAYIGVEAGLIVQGANYKGQDFIIQGDDMRIHLNNVVIPILLKAHLAPSKKLEIGAGLGPAFIIHASGDYEYNILIHFADEFAPDNLATDVGLQLKGDVGIKLMPALWLRPALTVQLNPNPDNPFNTDERSGDEATAFISVGIVFKL